MNINDWKIIQMRNDVKYIKRHAVGNNAAGWSLVIDVFLVLLAFTLDRIFSDSSTETISAMWIAIAVGGLFIPAGLFIWETIKVRRIEKISRRVINVKELVAIFDDEICYMIMSAETFNKSIKEMKIINSRQAALLLEFNVIEAEYYLNKAVQLILKMDNNLIAVLDEDDLTKNHISRARLVNAIRLLASFYEELFDLAKTQSTALKDHMIYLNLDAMQEHYEALKSFATDRKDLIGIDIKNAFKSNQT